MIKGIALLLITVIAWGVMYPSSKTATEVGIDGFYLSSIRYGFGVILTSLILLFSEGIKAFDYTAPKISDSKFSIDLSA